MIEAETPGEGLAGGLSEDERDGDLDALEERFRGVMRRNEAYRPISSPGLMFEVLKRVRGSVVADVGCGAGLFSHIARLGWYHTLSYSTEDVASPWLLGVDVNDGPGATGLCQNYDAFVRGTSDRLRLADASVDTIVCIENLEHLTPDAVTRSLDEFERVARRRVVVTTPSPLHFMPEKQFRDRARLLARRKVKIDEEMFAKLASAVHKTCVDPRSMIERGYEIDLYDGEWPNHPIYVKDVESSPGPAGRPGLGEDEDDDDFGVGSYLAELARAYPWSPATIARFADVSPGVVERLYEEDRREGNRRADYLNLVCASLLENDRIEEGARNAFRAAVRERRAGVPSSAGWIGRIRARMGGAASGESRS